MLPKWDLGRVDWEVRYYDTDPAGDADLAGRREYMGRSSRGPTEQVPEGGQCIGAAEAGLPVPEFAKFHVAGFRINVLSGSSVDFRAVFRMLVRNVETGEWTTVQSEGFFPRLRDESERATWEDDWKRFVYHHMRTLLLHELDECLLFGGINLREPHPELRARARPSPAILRVLKDAGLLEAALDKSCPPSKAGRTAAEEMLKATREFK